MDQTSDVNNCGGNGSLDPKYDCSGTGIDQRGKGDLVALPLAALLTLWP
jgi:hypothetical protein